VKVAACFCVIYLLAVAGGSQAAGEVSKLNDLLQSATERYDVATVSKLASNDFVLVNGAGQIWNRDAFLKDIGDKSAVWQANDPQDVTVRTYNDDTAVLIGLLHIKYTQAGTSHDVLARYTDVWVKLDGKWRYVSGQASLYKRL
jgi:hypothetical protein